uniref:Uncharacterized protein n=1 Tax=Fagus sylvatica TaxID=28930 RepID=A0A2N9H9N2_FAGSY
MSSDSVLHRLSTELYFVVFPAISTWEVIRNWMAANETEWSLPLSDELSEGLSDELPTGEVREVSSEVTPSTSGSRPLPRVNRSWKALSYFSKINQDDIDRIRGRYQIHDDVVLRIPDSDERACCPKYEGDIAFYEADFQAGLRFPMQPFVRELLDYLSLASGQVASNGWWTIISCMVMWRVNSNGREDLTVDEFLFCYEPCQIALSLGFWTFKHRDMDIKIVQGLPSSNRIWKNKYFFVWGYNWERLPQKDPRDFVKVRRSWGTPSSPVLDRPLLNSVWKERISRISDIEDRCYGIFIEPDLLTSFSFGPAPNATVKALVQANKKSVPVNLKRRKVGEGSSRRVEEKPSRPPAGDAIPLVKTIPQVVMMDVDHAPPTDPTEATITQSPHVAMARAKSAVTSKDLYDYAAAHAEDVHYFLVHSLMRRCISVEEDLATLRAKSIADEVEMKNTKKAVLELTSDRKEALVELEKVKKELKAGDDDVKIEGAKAAAVSEFRASEVFEDINMRYFLSGFEAFRKQATQRFPDLEFSALQPYDDEDLVVDASQDDQAGDDDASSK